MSDGKLFLPLPYVSRLIDTLEPMHTLVVQGQVPQDASRFSVNLTSGYSETVSHDIIALHVNFRFDQRMLVLNSFSDHWEEEELHPNTLCLGQLIDLRIFMKMDEFEIWVNKERVGSFTHRHPFGNITHVKICGDLSLHSAHWRNRRIRTPFNYNFHQPLSSGQQVHVYGVAQNDFNINFDTNSEEIPFHYNPRFSEHQVVRNNFTNRKWGAEERCGDFNFEKGKPFTLVFSNQAFGVKVYLNGKHSCTFDHRANPAGCFKKLRIEGAIEILGIEIVEALG